MLSKGKIIQIEETPWISSFKEAQKYISLVSNLLLGSLSIVN